EDDPREIYVGAGVAAGGTLAVLDLLVGIHGDWFLSDGLIQLSTRSSVAGFPLTDYTHEGSIDVQRGLSYIAKAGAAVRFLDLSGTMNQTYQLVSFEGGEQESAGVLRVNHSQQSGLMLRLGAHQHKNFLIVSFPYAAVYDATGLYAGLSYVSRYYMRADTPYSARELLESELRVIWIDALYNPMTSLVQGDTDRLSVASPMGFEFGYSQQTFLSSSVSLGYHISLGVPMMIDSADFRTPDTISVSFMGSLGYGR
ncbi:MAG: hypothetical protein ACOC0D_09940, partial [Spirochaeta sp.]